MRSNINDISKHTTSRICWYYNKIPTTSRICWYYNKIPNIHQLLHTNEMGTPTKIKHTLKWLRSHINDISIHTISRICWYYNEIPKIHQLLHTPNKIKKNTLKWSVPCSALPCLVVLTSPVDTPTKNNALYTKNVGTPTKIERTLKWWALEGIYTFWTTYIAGAVHISHSKMFIFPYYHPYILALATSWSSD